ncbi:winged helix-turn-helix transcriptional regulator [Nocardia donostiensis]|uniref:Transcriptional regulator n=1 Tax=Nocardia donostiensis TaxID=1538463 RepID=A0A1W0B7R8_9NOCA|nr:helix-turn-helix domain-containing protein [Nocardia donostiensis]ONM46295.1 transcriptional regulator [Nocardia donostiensis]OQS18559.1 transcriptional regulator [Nocardia donostiensis]
MRETNLAHMDCSIARTVEIIGDRWTLMIVRSMFAFKGLHRFDELRTELGISTNILADRLESLIEHGVVEQRRYSEKPPRHEYHLTTAGKDLLPVILALLRWGDTYLMSEQGPPVLLRHTDCDHDTLPYLACSHCHKPIAPRAILGRDAPSRSAGTGR